MYLDQYKSKSGDATERMMCFKDGQETTVLRVGGPSTEPEADEDTQRRDRDQHDYEGLLADEATEEQVRVVVEAIEELELVEAEQHLYIHIHMQQGKASESSE